MWCWACPSGDELIAEPFFNQTVCYRLPVRAGDGKDAVVIFAEEIVNLFGEFWPNTSYAGTDPSDPSLSLWTFAGAFQLFLDFPKIPGLEPTIQDREKLLFFFIC